MLATGTLARADWPQFRGPTGDGWVSHSNNSRSAKLPLQWSETENVKWKTEIRNRGWSTPVVMGGQIWLTTATPEGHDFFALCVDAESGKVKFEQKLFHADSPEPLGNAVNCYATPSAVIEPGRVYVHFGSYGTACLDTSSFKTLWQREDLRCRHYRGPSSSPLLFKNLLILTFDGADLQYLIALDKMTGSTVWKTNRSVAWNDENVPGQMARDGDLRKAHSTPLLVEIQGKPTLLSTGAKAAYAYDARTGDELWRVHFDSWSAAPMPVYGDGLAYIITGHGKTELWAVRVDGHGDVTDTHVAWKFGNLVAKTTSPILVNGLLYMVSDDGFVTCLEAKEGKEVWHKRIEGNYAASPICGGDNLYFCNQLGKTTILKPGQAFELVATNKLEAGFMASPAVADNSLILRTKTHLYRITEPKTR